jgi:hypothetical protein
MLRRGFSTKWKGSTYRNKVEAKGPAQAGSNRPSTHRSSVSARFNALLGNVRGNAVFTRRIVKKQFPRRSQYS